MDHEYVKASGLVGAGGECPETVAEQGSRFREPKSCTDCRTTKTPLWRGGPSGPKSLCNACGIRYRKRRRELLGLQGQDKKKKGRRPGSRNGDLRVLGLRRDAASLKRRALIQLVKQRCRWRPLGEVEEAAVLLVALSSGFLYAQA